jgi:HSP20 family protein
MKRKYSIFDEFQKMQDRLDNLFESFWNTDPFSKDNNYLLDSKKQNNKDLITNNYKSPVSDIYETEKDVIAELELPGINKKDIKVQVDENGIEIKTENKNENRYEDKKKGIYRFERNYSGFYRYFSLPKNVDSKNALAEYKDGILKVKVPKTEIIEDKKRYLDIK